MDQRQSARRWSLARVVWLILFVSSCQVPSIPEAYLPVIDGPLEASPRDLYQPVSRQEVIQMARRYAGHRWTPTEQNVWHGLDPEGVLVDTPDVSFRQSGIRPGWWQVGVENQGIPFQWGGYATIAEFDAGIAKGLAGGDILTQAKRTLLGEGAPTVSRFAVGIGSSGFISRCWRLERSHSTREFTELCDLLESYEDLRPGDILNLRDVHAILFEQFADDRRKALLGYEAGAPPSWKVLYNHLPVSHLKRLGYQPLRFRHIRGASDDARVLGLQQTTAPEPAGPVTVPGPDPEISAGDPNAPFL